MQHGDDPSPGGGPPPAKKQKLQDDGLDPATRRTKEIMNCIMHKNFVRLERLLALRGACMDRDKPSRIRQAPYLMVALIVDIMTEEERCHCIRLLSGAGHSLQGSIAINLANRTTVFDCFSYSCMKCMNSVVRCMLELGALPNPVRTNTVTMRPVSIYGAEAGHQGAHNPFQEINLQVSTASSLTMALSFYSLRESAHRMRCIILDLLRAGADVNCRERVFVEEPATPLEICVKQNKDPYMAECLHRVGARPYPGVFDHISQVESQVALTHAQSQQFAHLRRLLRAPRRLAELCRVTVRARLGQGWAVTRRVQQVSPSTPLADFLDLHDVIQLMKRHYVQQREGATGQV